MFYQIYIIAVMLVAPVLCALIECLAKKHKGKAAFTAIVRWFVFWALGVRLLTAGLMQVLNPSFTADLLSLAGGNDVIIQEHGFANIALGTLGVLSLFWDKFRKPACFGIGLYIAGAAILHFMRIELMTVDEWATLLADVFLVVIAVFGFFQKEKAGKKK